MTSRSRLPAVAVALSGGVDSSTAAALLLEAGHEVVALTMDLGLGEGPLEQARAVAAHLGVSHHVVDCREGFRDEVLRPCWEAYDQGNTPNPCVLCNPRVKLRLLSERGRQLGAELVATGHHARIVEDRGGSRLLARGADPDKDQSYFLYDLSTSQLASTRFPVGGMTKGEVRARAADLGLPSAAAPESQDACIAAPGRSAEAFAETLRQLFEATARPGGFRDEGGRLVGRHEGIHCFTVGQRRGLGVSLGRRAWVTDIDGSTADVHLSRDPADLLASGLVASAVRWHREPADPDRPQVCSVQIRSRHEPARARVTAHAPSGHVEVRFEEPQKAVAPGQAAVFYEETRVIGGGRIQACLRDAK